VTEAEKKRVLLVVSGSIAAYKAAEVASKLCGALRDVRVVMTESATRFVGPATFQALTGHPVCSDMWASPEHWNAQHIDLARFADVIMIAPATARTIARLALGLADDLASCVVLASKAPVIVAPAMNEAMWNHPAVRANVERLRSLGYEIVEPGEGRLACGVEGKGRLADVPVILEAIERKLS